MLALGCCLLLSYDRVRRHTSIPAYSIYGHGHGGLEPLHSLRMLASATLRACRLRFIFSACAPQEPRG